MITSPFFLFCLIDFKPLNSSSVRLFIFPFLLLFVRNWFVHSFLHLQRLYSDFHLVVHWFRYRDSVMLPDTVTYLYPLFCLANFCISTRSALHNVINIFDKNETLGNFFLTCLCSSLPNYLSILFPLLLIHLKLVGMSLRSSKDVHKYPVWSGYHSYFSVLLLYIFLYLF